MATLNLFSPLYCRLNGFMLGIFLTVSTAKSINKRYPFYRLRIHQFFEEVGINAKLPQRHADYVTLYHGQDVIQKILIQLSERSKELLDFFVLGLDTINYLIQIESDRSTAEFFRRDIYEKFKELNLEFQVFERLTTTGSKLNVNKTIDEVITRSLSLLSELLKNSKTETKTCFVAFPFSEPYESFYMKYYRPTLLNSGYRPIRAWGGFGNEDFSPLLTRLILKSQLLMADISEPNENVIWETGVALGASKEVIFFANESRIIPSDLGKNIVLRYKVKDNKTWIMNDEKDDQGIVRWSSLMISLLRGEGGKAVNDKSRFIAGVRAPQVFNMLNTVKDIFYMAIEGMSEIEKRKNRAGQRMKEKRMREAEEDLDYIIGDSGFLKMTQAKQAPIIQARGIVCYSLGNTSKARMDFEKVLKSKSKNGVEIIPFLADILMDSNEYDKGLSYLNKLIGRQPGHALGLRMRIEIYARKGSKKLIERDILKLHKVSTDTYEVNFANGFLCLSKAQYERASKYFSKTLRKYPDNRFYVALCCLLVKKFSKAHQLYAKALQKADDISIDKALGELEFWTRQQKVDESVKPQIAFVKDKMLEVRTPKEWGFDKVSRTIGDK